MRINNSKVKNVIISTYFLLIVLALILSILFSAYSEISTNPALSFILIFFSFSALFLLLFGVTKFFEYDSDGVKVGVMNKSLLLSEYLIKKEHVVEFEKEKLIGFKFQNFIVYKRLVLYIMSSHGHKKKEVFNVTLVERKKRKYIKQSLNKIIRHNRTKKKNS
ncbi:MAG: hypothetical protein KAJ28_03060 [Flavobacteriaceae bacterium]|nr:hypothetical protein [Flavobacteriaceae bacterium]